MCRTSHNPTYDRDISATKINLFNGLDRIPRIYILASVNNDGATVMGKQYYVLVTQAVNALNAETVA